jgi:hypothetical protein
MCPYGKPGDILWVRETWGNYSYDYPESNAVYFLYRADYPPNANGYWYEPEHINFCNFPKWRPSIHMPKEACRIKLCITDIRVQRLQDISEEDARAEGIRGWTKDGQLYKYCVGEVGDNGNVWSELPYTAIDAFHLLWDKINMARGHGWEQNDWVRAITFERLT